MLPEWLKKRYDILYERFGVNSFRFEEAVSLLEEKIQDKREQVNVFLSELKKARLLVC